MLLARVVLLWCCTLLLGGMSVIGINLTVEIVFWGGMLGLVFLVEGELMTKLLKIAKITCTNFPQ